MANIDYSTPVGKLRMRLGDVSDLPFLSNSIYEAVYAENDNNLRRAVVACGSMILGQLAFKTHRKINALELWGAEAYTNYKQFLLTIISNPAFSEIAPIPYSASGTTKSDMIQFMSDWKQNFPNGTQSQQLAYTASLSPNDGSLFGPLGTKTGAWEGIE